MQYTKPVPINIFYTLYKINAKTIYKIAQYFFFWLSQRRKYSFVDMATTAFFIKTKSRGFGTKYFELFYISI